MIDDIVTDLRRMADARVYSIRKRMHEAADEIERLRQALWDCATIAGADTDGNATPYALAYPDIADFAYQAVLQLREDYDGLTGVSNDALEAEMRQLNRRIHELETKIGWYKAVNAQLRDDLIEANADFQALARTPAPTFDPLDAIVLGLRRENDARKSH